MKELSDAGREELRKQLAEYHTQRLKEIARNIDRRMEAENKNLKRGWFTLILGFILELFLDE